MNKFFLKVLNKLNLLEKVNVEVPIYINNRQFLIPVIGKTGYSNVFTTEPWMIRLLEELFRFKKGSFIDVGVNIGQTLLKLRSVNEEVTYVGFEPNSSCVNYTSKLIQVSKIKNATLMPFGVSDQTGIGVLNFFDTGSTDSTASMIAEFRPEQKIERKVFIPLFESFIFEKFLGQNAIGFLKIDVEGAELEVLNSFVSIVKKNKPFILLEILPVYKKTNIIRIERQAKIEALINEFEYCIYRIIKNENRIERLKEVDSFGIHSDLDQCDYVCAPRSNRDNLINLTF